jgi:hypothetical protein
MSESDRNDALSRGFSAGNYANAYVSEDFDQAWESEDEEDRLEDDERIFKHPDYKSAFLIGFFGSYEEDEISADHVDDWRDAYYRLAKDMQEIGIAAVRDDDDDDDDDDGSDAGSPPYAGGHKRDVPAGDN